ncbi:hypothetical protein AMTRI_Chr01g105680 [Amborella trichopoda]
MPFALAHTLVPTWRTAWVSLAGATRMPPRHLVPRHTPRIPQPILQCCASRQQTCGPSMRCAKANSLVLTTHTAWVCLASADLYAGYALCPGARLGAHHPYRAGVLISGNLEPIVALCLATHLSAHMAYCLGVLSSATGRPSRCRVPRCTPRCPPGKLCRCALLGLRECHLGTVCLGAHHGAFNPSCVGLPSSFVPPAL